MTAQTVRKIFWFDSYVDIVQKSAGLIIMSNFNSGDSVQALPLGSSKKNYVAMQVSQLGKFSELTQAGFFGMYRDGGTSSSMGSSVLPPNRLQP
ncbi:MAG: hypothetical protein ACKO7W_13730 [Elainella sp.]